MDRLKLSSIDEELESSEVAALCFLCRDVVNKKRLEGIGDAKKLFLRLEEKGLLDNHLFLRQLLQTIGRADLLNFLETDSRRPEETDANPMLSEYRVLLYKVYADMTNENFEKMKFLLSDKLGRRQIETCKTALDVFAEMEKNADLLSNTNLRALHATLLQFDQQLALTIQRYMDGVTQLPPQTRSAHFSVDYQRVNNPRQPTQPIVVSMSETQPGDGGASVCPDAAPHIESPTPPDDTDYYALTNKPRGLCVVINNEEFLPGLKDRQGSRQDAKSLDTVFTSLGFNVVTHNNLTAGDMRRELQQLGSRNFLDDDALVVCVLSHGLKGCVFGTEGQKVYLQELTQPFTSREAPTLARKPKLFFIQACQESDYQRGPLSCPVRPRQEEGDRRGRQEEDAGRVHSESVLWDADFLLGMAAVPESRLFRNPVKGSIYIQALCAQLTRSAESSGKADILDVLKRVNREVSQREMPEPKNTLTKKLVLKFV